jgi:hypothetical protein
MQKSVCQYGISIRTNGTSDLSESSRISYGDAAADSEVALEISKEITETERDVMKEKEKMFSSTAAWTAMRLQLLAHSTHIARENGDFNTAASSLCTMIRLMGALEAVQQEQLAAWSSSMASMESDKEEGSNPPGLKSTYSTELLSEMGDDSVRSQKEDHGIATFGRLLGTAEGRRILSSELLNHKWRQHLSGRANTDTPMLCASNINRLVGSPSNGQSLPGSAEKPLKPPRRPTSTNSKMSNGIGGRRATASTSNSLFGSDLDRLVVYNTNAFPARPESVNHVKGGSGSGRYPVGVSHVTTTPQRHSSLIFKGERERRDLSKYDDEPGGDFGVKHRRKGSGSSMHSSGLRRGHNVSVTGSVSSSSCYTVFSPPSILGISENTEKRRKRLQMNKKRNTHSAAGRLIKAQLQSYQTITTGATEAANFLSTMLLPDGQPMPVPPPSKGSIPMTPAGMVKAGLNLSQMSASRMKLPSASRISSIVLNSSTPSVRTPSVVPTTPTPETRSDTVTSSTSQKSGCREELALITEGDETSLIVDTPAPSSSLSLCLNSLSRMLFEGGVTTAQQDQGVELLEQLSREVQHKPLPLSFLSLLGFLL